MARGECCSVLLATSNGAVYLSFLLSSLESQTCRPDRVFVRDDNSNDLTPGILKTFCAEHPDFVHILADNSDRLGTIGNFSKLLSHADTRYILFCDQDDVWLPGKLEKTLSVMREAENRFGLDVPILVHTDLCVVDANLQTIATSFWKYQNLSPQLGFNLNREMPQNVVTGCTVMINRPLANLASPIPQNVIMHDWWLALVAAAFGQIVYLDEPTVLYRQHGTNSIGAKRWGMNRIVTQALSTGEVRSSMLRTMQQAKLLLERYSDKLTSEQLVMITAYSNLPFMSKSSRIITVFKYKFFKHGIIRNIGFLLNLLMLERTNP